MIFIMCYTFFSHSLQHLLLPMFAHVQIFIVALNRVYISTFVIIFKTHSFKTFKIFETLCCQDSDGYSLSKTGGCLAEGGLFTRVDTYCSEKSTFLGARSYLRKKCWIPLPLFSDAKKRTIKKLQQNVVLSS